MGEMLDYIYFHTEPMEGAERNEELDFSGVNRSVGESPGKTVIRKNKLHASAPKLRQRLKKAIQARQTEKKQFTTPPRYDEVFHQGLLTLDNDTDY